MHFILFNKHILTDNEPTLTVKLSNCVTVVQCEMQCIVNVTDVVQIIFILLSD